MGKQNLLVNRMLERKENFADFINGVIYGGRQVLRADMLESLSCHSGVIYEENGKKRVLEREADMGTYSLVLTNELQDKVHYAMPVRVMLEDALEYVKQVQDLEKKHKEAGEKLTGDAFLSGIMREDRLTPVITTVLYCGPGWDGCKSIYEMLDINEEKIGNIRPGESLWEFLQNYRINLVDVRTMKDMQVFQGCLQHIFNMVKYNSDKKKFYKYINDHRKEIQQMDRVEQMAALALLGEQKRLIQVMDGEESKKEEMCKAIDDLIEDGWMRGKAEGKIEGKTEGKTEAVLLLLSEIGHVSEKLTERIQKEDDSEVLSRWLIMAARAKSLEQFELEMEK